MSPQQIKIFKKMITYTLALGLVYLAAKVTFGPFGKFTFGLGFTFFTQGPSGWLVGVLWFALLWIPMGWFGFEWWRDSRRGDKNG